MIPRVALVALPLIGSVMFSQAELRLHNLFTDHMVLQQDTTLPVWGWGDDGDRVTVEFTFETDDDASLRRRSVASSYQEIPS